MRFKESPPIQWFELGLERLQATSKLSRQDSVDLRAIIDKALPFIAKEDERSSTMLWETDVHAKGRWASDAFCEFTGVAMKEREAGEWVDPLHPDERLSVATGFMEAFNSRTQWVRALRLRRVDGVYRWVFDIGFPQLDRTGDFIGYRGTIIEMNAEQRDYLVDTPNRRRSKTV